MPILRLYIIHSIAHSLGYTSQEKKSLCWVRCMSGFNLGVCHGAPPSTLKWFLQQLSICEKGDVTSSELNVLTWRNCQNHETFFPGSFLDLAFVCLFLRNCNHRNLTMSLKQHYEWKCKNCPGNSCKALKAWISERTIPPKCVHVCVCPAFLGVLCSSSLSPLLSCFQ
jgi:hypothetical protein